MVVDPHLQRMVEGLFPRINRCFPGAMLAGGAIRDILIGKQHPNDLDFFVPFNGTIEDATLRLLNEGLCSLFMGQSDYHHTRRDIGISVKQRLDRRMNLDEKLKVLIFHSHGNDYDPVEIILSPIEADRIAQWYIDFQQIPLNTGHMFVGGQMIIPPAMRADLETKRVTVIGTSQKSRAEYLAKCLDWPLIEN